MIYERLLIRMLTLYYDILEVAYTHAHPILILKRLLISMLEKPTLIYESFPLDIWEHHIYYGDFT